MVIRDAVGREREATRTYGDGSVDCPFCSSPIIIPKTECENPWCVAHPRCTPLVVLEMEYKQAKNLLERAERRRDSYYAMQRIADDNKQHQDWLAATYAEARERGACLKCCIAPGWQQARFVKHRGECPKSKNGGKR